MKVEAGCLDESRDSGVGKFDRGVGVGAYWDGGSCEVEGRFV